MIKVEENKPKSHNLLEALRSMSESVSDEQVLELFKDSATQIHNEIVHSTAKNFVDITEIEKGGNNGLVLLAEISKAVEIEPFDTDFLDNLLKKSVGLALPEWMNSQDAIVKAKKVTALKKLKSSLNKNYCDVNVFVEDFISLFDITEHHPAATNFRNSFYGKQSYMTGSSFLLRNGNQFSIFLDKITKSRFLLNKPISIYFSLSTGKLSRIDDGNSFIVADLDLKISDGTMNTLMSSLRQKDSSPVEVVKKLISSGLKKKYLYLSKNKASFEGFRKGRFPFSFLPDEEIRSSLQYKGVYDLKEFRKLVPKPELERYDSIVDGLLGR
jgi:hypothetical protein